MKLLGEIESTHVLGNDEMYNDQSNGATGRATVIDPNGTELNRLQLSYKNKLQNIVSVDWVKAVVGRQNINLDNQRFIGTVGWRQNSQTFDAATINVKAFNGFKLGYGYITEVHRIHGDDHPLGNLESESHFVNASYKIQDIGKLTAYGYFLDLADTPGLSSKTVGLRFKGKHDLSENVKGMLTLEYASQSDYGDNTADYDEDYMHAKAAVKYAAIKGF